MVVEDALRAYLVSQTTVTDLLDSVKSIRTDYEPEKNNRPFIYIQLIRTEPFQHSTGSATLALTDLRLHCEGASQTKSRQIAESIRILFKDGYQGVMGFPFVYIRSLTVTRISNRPRPLFANAEQGLPAATADITILHEQDNDNL